MPDGVSSRPSTEKRQLPGTSRGRRWGGDAEPGWGSTVVRGLALLVGGLVLGYLGLMLLVRQGIVSRPRKQSPTPEVTPPPDTAPGPVTPAPPAPVLPAPPAPPAPPVQPGDGDVGTDDAKKPDVPPADEGENPPAAAPGTETPAAPAPPAGTPVEPALKEAPSDDGAAAAKAADPAAPPPAPE